MSLSKLFRWGKEPVAPVVPDDREERERILRDAENRLEEARSEQPFTKEISIETVRHLDKNHFTQRLLAMYGNNQGEG